jgi:single-strand DNA-binding protein
MAMNLRMPSINRVIISGNLVGDPRVNILENGVHVANFRIVNNQPYRTKAGAWEEKSVPIDIVAWRKTAELVQQFLHKGSPVLVEGELQESKWQGADGTENRRIEIVARRVQFLEKPGTQRQPEPEARPEKPSYPAAEEAPPDIDTDYDDIPF